MQASTFSWKTKDQIEIHAKHWKVESPKAVVGFVHGMGEHCGRYAHVAEAFASAGIASMGYDRRGHGQSGGQRGHTISYEAFIDEIKSLQTHLQRVYPNAPIFLYGHSMGGNLVLFYLIHHSEALQGVIASAPWIDLAFKPSAFKVQAGKIVRSLLPGISMKNDLDPKGLSRDAKEVQAYIDDPLVHNKITPNTGVFMMDKADYLNSFTGKVEKPLLIMHGSEDPVISFDAAKQFSERVEGGIEFKPWEGSFHEPHNDLDKEELMVFAKDWILKQI